MLSNRENKPVSFYLRAVAFYSMLAAWAGLTFAPALVEIGFAIAVIAWIAEKALDRKQVFIPRSLLIPLCAFTLIVLVSITWSEYPKESVRGIFKVLQQVFMFVLVADLFPDKERIKKFEIFFILLYALIVFDGFYQYAAGHDLLRHFALQNSGAGPRLSAAFKTYGLFGSYLISTIPYLLALAVRYYRDKNPLRLPAALLFVLSLAAALLTRSRGCLIALAGASALFLIYRRKWKWLLILFLGLSCFIAALPRNMVIHLDITRKEQSLAERYQLWKRALYVIEAKPLTGTGINTYTKSHARYDKSQNWRVRNYYAHNGYLQMAAEVGLPALMFFLLFLFQYYRFSLGQKAGISNRLILRWGLLTGIMAFLLLGAADTVMHSDTSVNTLWFLLGLQYAYALLPSGD